MVLLQYLLATSMSLWRKLFVDFTICCELPCSARLHISYFHKPDSMSTHGLRQASVLAQHTVAVSSEKILQPAQSLLQAA